MYVKRTCTRFEADENATNVTVLCLILTTSLLSLGCGSANEAHLFHIGTRFSLTKFTLTFPGGKSFIFNQAELENLDAAWDSCNVDVNTINQIMQTGTGVDYQLVLSDGFSTEFQGQVLKIGETTFLCLGLLGDGGGFPGDVISHVLELDDALNGDRLEKLLEMATRAKD